MSVKKSFFYAITLFISYCCNAQTIVSYNGVDMLFPKSWLQKPIKIKASAPKKELEKEAVRQIQKALNKYEAATTSQWIDTVFLLGTLSFNGGKYFSTSNENNLFLATDKNAHLEQSFHHEFAAILLKRNKTYFNRPAWVALSMPTSFLTKEAGSDGIYTIEIKADLLEKGYLNRYGTTTPEHDFQLYAENLFSGGKSFWTQVDKYSRIRQKTDLAIAFYYKLNNEYTETFFRSLAEKE